MAATPTTAVIWCVGIPVPQGSKSGYIIGEGEQARVVIQDGSSRKRKDGKTPSRTAHQQWRKVVAREAVAWCKANELGMPWDGPVAVDVTFWLPKPASKPRWKWRPDVKPDIDKLARSVLDSISGSIITGDGRVTDLSARKRYATIRGGTVDYTPGCRVAVSLLPEREVGPDIYALSGMIPADLP